MKLRSLAICLLSVLGVFLWMERSPEDFKLDAVDAAKSAVAEIRRDEPLSDLPEFRLPERLGISSYAVLDSSVTRLSANGFERKVLVRSRDVPRQFTIIVEEHKLDVGADEDSIAKWSARVGDELIFEMDRALVDVDRFARFVEEEQLVVVQRSRLSDFVQIRIKDVSLARYDRILEELTRLFPKAISEPDYLHFTSEIPDDYNPALMWNLDQVNAPEAWKVSSGSSEVVVGVIDTGIDIGHPDLIGNLWINEAEIAGNGIDDDGNGFIDDVSGWDFVNDDNDPSDVSSHGTHVSGTVGAQGDNGSGVVGMNWNVSILPLKAGEERTLSTSDIAEAMRYAAMMKDRGLNIVATNNSYGSGSSTSVSLREIRNHQDKGILFVAAAGNDGFDIDGANAQFPAGYDEDIVISVANTNQADELDRSSNFGVVSVDLGAPGKGIYSTEPGSRYGYKTGTSMASPLVAGAVALVASSNPSLAWRAIKSRILDTVDLVPALDGSVLTGGRLNVAAALSPSLVDFDLSVKNHPGGIIIVPDRRVPVVFEVDSPVGASLDVEVIGDAASVAITAESSQDYVLKFSKDGVYTVRFRGGFGGFARSTERTVFVGGVPEVGADLAHHWNFDGDGIGENDLAGSANGVLRNVSRVESVLGQAGRFSGNASSMSFPGEYAARVTLSAMVKADQINNNDHPRIINLEDYYLYISSDGGSGAADGNADVLKFYSNRTGEFGIWNTRPRSVQAGKWIHLAATYDSGSLDNNPTLYIDGRKQDVRVQRLPTGSQTTDGGLAFLGDRATGDRGYDGLMDEVRIYHRELSGSEVATLAAQHYEKRWEGYAIESTSQILAGQPIEFSFESALGPILSADYEWSVVTDEGSFSIESSAGAKALISINNTAEALVTVKVSDATATEYFSRLVSFEGPIFSDRSWRGESASGALIFVEVAASLDVGYATVYDPASGFYRVREKVAIDKDGRFTSANASEFEISGALGERFTAEVAGTELGFAGSSIAAAPVDSMFSGDYSGGFLERAGEHLTARILSGGEIVMTLDGFSSDFGFGRVDENGAFLISTAKGVSIEGQVAGDASSISGSYGIGLDSIPFYLRNASEQGASRFVNLSTRGHVFEGEGVLIGGFVVKGDDGREVLLRAVGPGLGTRFGLEGVLRDPSLLVLKRVGAAFEELAFNGNWEDDSSGAVVSTTSADVGAFALDAGSLDAAELISLEPGEYTAIVSGGVGETGEALFEVYDAQKDGSASFVNVSTRGRVSGSSRVLIGGFVVEGDAPKQILIRAIGEGLEAQGVDDFLRDPVLSVFRGQERLVGNDQWMDGTIGGLNGEPLQGPGAELLKAFGTTGAFELDSLSKDAALLVWLPPGPYTVIVSGANGASGIALVEAYEMP